jgi:DNA-binding MarR family transcriptional regulator
MKQQPLSINFQYALVSFLLQAKQNVLTAAAEFDLSSGQAFSLLLLDSKARSMKSYCQAYSCDAGNLTGIIDGLEEKGLVVREQDPADRRIKVVRMLPAGERIREKLLARLQEVNDELFSPLNATEQSLFANLIQKMHASQNNTV